MIVFDSNAVLRYVLQDNLEMADLVENQIKENSCFVPTEVIAEMIYVLSKVYNIPRQDISTAIKGILSIENITTANTIVVTKALEAYSDTKLDFVDCLMAGYQEDGYDVFTFDKALEGNT